MSCRIAGNIIRFHPGYRRGDKDAKRDGRWSPLNSGASRSTAGGPAAEQAQVVLGEFSGGRRAISTVMTPPNV
jgi:hypothetical protein